MQHREFARRLNQACDDLGTVPPLGQGRQVMFARKLKVSQEAVRKWFAGEARPRVRVLVELAKILNVDPAWLSFGVEPVMTNPEKKLYSKRTEGVVYLALGMSLLAGGSCARPADNDPRKEFVDYYMILDGEQIAVHTTLGREVGPNEIEFMLPREYDQVKNLGVVFSKGSRIQMLDLKNDLVDKHKQKLGGGWRVCATIKGGNYVSGKDEWPQITSIEELVA
jgi:transcriptional regulator with XRE-family HTH domain